MNDDDGRALIGPDGESTEPLPVPVRSIHLAWFVVAIVLGLAVTVVLVVLLNRFQEKIGVQSITWPTPTPDYSVRDITREPTLAPILTIGSRLLPLKSRNVDQLAHLYTFPDPVETAHFGVEINYLTVYLIRNNYFVRREIYSSRSTNGMLERFPAAPITFSTDPNVAASGGTGDNILLWNIQRGVVDRELPPLNAPLTALAFSGNGMLLAGGAANGEILIWNVFKYNQVEI